MKLNSFVIILMKDNTNLNLIKKANNEIITIVLCIITHLFSSA